MAQALSARRGSAHAIIAYGKEGHRLETPISIDKESIAAFCEKHHIVKLALFRSVLTDHFTENSDVDILVEFRADHVPGMIRLCGMERELSELEVIVHRMQGQR